MSDKLDLLKFRSGIPYSDEMMDKAVQAEILACEEYLREAGVPENLLDSERADKAKVLWIKNALDMDADLIVNERSFIDLIGQLRAGGDTT